MENNYAQALWQMVENGTTPARAVRSLYEMLERHGRAALMPRIARAFLRIASREQARSTVVLSMAREKDTRAKQEAKRAFVTFGKGEGDVVERIDETLIGGWRLEGQGQVIDASFKKALLDVYNGATFQ
ncbi:hypothetical protein A3H74_01300 [Candidatus Kaiserbacteria bacterium RIFCSPLOWO2_02_FULL_51_13]|nr:MAG: hypothetical protein A3H74_01300 [Candidatus Kaiserbacteria bacterium RIFCSPLOWO2_02_FULL_51_13]